MERDAVSDAVDTAHVEDFTHMITEADTIISACKEEAFVVSCFRDRWLAVGGKDDQAVLYNLQRNCWVFRVWNTNLGYFPWYFERLCHWFVSFLHPRTRQRFHFLRSWPRPRNSVCTSGPFDRISSLPGIHFALPECHSTVPLVHRLSFTPATWQS